MLLKDIVNINMFFRNKCRYLFWYNKKKNKGLCWWKFKRSLYRKLTYGRISLYVKNSICLIGNSSSGIIEAPSLGIYTINIGDRQKEGVRGNSVIDVKCDRKQIDEAISRVINMKDNIEINNPYYKENSIKEYYKYTKMILEHIIDDIKEPKIFYDIKMQEDI